MLMIVDANDYLIHYGKTTVKLTRMEFLLFSFLIAHKNVRRFKTEDIIRHVWKDRCEVINNNNLNQLTFKIRRKMTELDNFLSFRISKNSEGEITVNKRTIIISVHSSRLARVVNAIYKRKRKI